MPRWWTGWMALVTAVLPGLVFLTSVVTFGLALPFWLIAANLWWVLAFRGVWLFARQSGGRSRAWGALGGAVLAVAGLFFGVVALALARLPAMEAEVLARLAGPLPQSLE